jgi:hypothetical protein
MGGVKAMIQARESRHAAAIKIALDAGVLKECDFHDFLLEGDSDIEDAFRLGNSRFSSHSMGSIFENRIEMTDAIKEVVEDAAEKCPVCDKVRYE